MFFSFRMVFFYLVTTGWIFHISLCENSINQNQSFLCSAKCNLNTVLLIAVNNMDGWRERRGGRENLAFLLYRNALSWERLVSRLYLVSYDGVSVYRGMQSIYRRR